MAFQYSITAIGTIVLQACLNTLGSVAAAGFAAASKIEQVVSQAYVALGTTMATYCAQNTGAGEKAVSYTHLDVYKRQERCNAGGCNVSEVCIP